MPSIALQRESYLWARPRGTAQAQIDSSGIESAQHREVLCDFQWTVVREHDASASDPDTCGGCGDGADEDLRACACETGSAMMLGDPVARVAEIVG
jgi:hypothetical protein